MYKHQHVHIMNNTHQPCSADVAVVTAKLNSHAAPSSGPVSTAQPLKLASNVAPRDAQGVFSLHSGTLIDGTEHAIPLKFTSDVAKNGAEGASTGMQLERTQQHSIHIPPNHNFTPTHIQKHGQNHTPKHSKHVPKSVPRVNIYPKAYPKCTQQFSLKRSLRGDRVYETAHIYVHLYFCGVLPK